MEANERNLYEFYQALGDSNFLNVVSNDHFSLISDKNGGWPQIIFKLRENAFLSEISQGILSITGEQMKHFQVVVDRNRIDETNSNALRAAGIFPVAVWELMEITEPVPIRFTDADRFKIERIRTQDEITEFTDHVNLCMMGDKKIDAGLFFKVVHDDRFAFFGLTIDDEIVSSLLAFSTLKVSGLYFIATKPSCRGKGFAEKLVRYSVNFLFGEGKEKVVLQSVRKAVPLYSRIGFKSNGQLALLQKI